MLLIIAISGRYRPKTNLEKLVMSRYGRKLRLMPVNLDSAVVDRLLAISLEEERSVSSIIRKLIERGLATTDKEDQKTSAA